MSRFLTDLNVRLTNESAGTWTVTSPLIYQSDLADDFFKVPMGFETDFASVPRVPFVFDLMGDLAHAAATLHDCLYSTGEVSRKVADQLFREAAIASGVTPWKAWAMYVAVRIFGASRYLSK